MSFLDKLKIYVSVPTQICYDNKRYEKLKQDMRDLYGLVEDKYPDYQIVWFDANKDEWNESWNNTVKHANLILHYCQPGMSNHLGRGGFNIWKEHDNIPQYIMYKPIHGTFKYPRLYNMAVAEDTINTNDWNNYVELEWFSYTPFTKVIDFIRSIKPLSDNTSSEDMRKAKDFVDSLMSIDIYG